jgi:hypothetical protein
MPYSGYISLLVIIFHYFSFLSLLRDTHYCCLVSLIGFFANFFHYCCEFRIHINRHYFQLVFGIVYYCLDLKSKRTVTYSSIIGLIGLIAVIHYCISITVDIIVIFVIIIIIVLIVSHVRLLGLFKTVSVRL